MGFDATRLDSEDLWASDFASAVLNWPRSAERAKEMWDTLGVSSETKPGMRILDVACGSGVKSFTLAQTDVDVRVTVLDFPKVLEVVARVAKAMGVKGKLILSSGDALTADFGTKQFDIVLFGLILHYFNIAQVGNILQRAHKALKPGGLVVINSSMADEERCQAEYALMTAFQLFIFCPESEVYTFLEYREVLEQAGFTNVTQHNDSLVSARKQQ